MEEINNTTMGPYRKTSGIIGPGDKILGITATVHELNSQHAEIERLREALQRVANWSPFGGTPNSYTRDEIREIARTALETRE